MPTRLQLRSPPPKPFASGNTLSPLFELGRSTLVGERRYSVGAAELGSADASCAETFTKEAF
jgi:hypothetical protein